MARRKKGQAEAADPDAPRALRLADHPKATRQIRTVRAWSAITAFLLVLLLALRAKNTAADALTVALEAGIAGYVAAWAVMVVAWRQLAQAEIEHARKRIVAALLEMEAAERGGPTVTG